MSLPRVTEILRAVGLSRDYTGVPSYYAQRGTAFNEAIDLDATGELDEASLHPDLWPGIEAYRAFVKETQHEAHQSQVAFEARDGTAGGFSGHIDRLGSVRDRKRAVIEFKYTDNPDLIGLRYQVAAYRLGRALTLPGALLLPGFGVILSPSGKGYTLHEFWDAADLDVFRAALTVYRAIQAREVTQ